MSFQAMLYCIKTKGVMALLRLGLPVSGHHRSELLRRDHRANPRTFGRLCSFGVKRARADFERSADLQSLP